MVLVFSGFVIVFTDSALGTALIQRRDLARKTARPCSGERRDRPPAHARRASRSRARSLASTASRRSRRSSSRSRSSFFVTRARHDAVRLSSSATWSFAASSCVRSPRRSSARSSGSRSRWPTSARGRSWRSSSPKQPCRPCFSGSSRLGGLRLTFSLASLRRLGGFAGNVFGENLLYQAGRNLSSLADRPFPRRGLPRDLHARDQRHPRAVLAHRGPAPAGLLPGVLAHGRRPRAHGRRLDPRHPARRR